MAKKERYEDLTNSIIELIGGKDNISYFTHCITRLRFNLKDRSLAKVEEIEKINGVIGSQWQNEQLQIIIGQEVGAVYNLICEKIGLKKEKTFEEKLDTPKEKFSIGVILDAITGSISPLIPLMIGAGMLQVLVLLLSQLGILDTESSTYMVLNFAGQAGFYFLPIFVGASAANKFGVNMGLGMLMGAMLVHPAFIEIVEAGESLTIIGLPIFSVSYAFTMFPVILSVYVMSHVQRFLGKISPNAIKSIIEPLFTIIVMIPLVFVVIGPAGAFLGQFLADAVMWLYNTAGFVGVALLAAFYPFIVLTGMHSAFTPIFINAIVTMGFEPIIVLSNVIANMGQGAAALAVAIKTKDTNLKSLASSGAITAILGGVTEPALFGVNLKYKKPMIGAMIGSLVGGAIAGLMGVVLYAFPGSGGVFVLPAFVGPVASNLIFMIVSMVITIVVTFIATLILYKDEEVN